MDATEMYSSTFYFAAAMFLTAALLFYLLPFTQTLKSETEPGQEF